MNAISRVTYTCAFFLFWLAASVAHAQLPTIEKIVLKNGVTDATIYDPFTGGAGQSVDRATVASLKFVATIASGPSASAVVFHQDGSSFATDSSAPFEGTIATPATGAHTYLIIPFSTGGQAGPSVAPVLTVTDSNPSDAPVAALSASRISGVAPLAVHFSAVGTTDTGDTSPFHNLNYTFNFGEKLNNPAYAEVWGTSSVWADKADPFSQRFSKDQFIGGPIAGHVYESPGTFTARVTATDSTGKSGTKTVTITVSDPTTVYAGGLTTCVRSEATGTFDGCPMGAAQQTQASFNTALTNFGGTGKRVLFRRGDTFSGGFTTFAAGPATVGAFGSGDRPIISNNPSSASSFTTFNYGGQDWRLMDVDIRNPATSAVSGQQIGVKLASSSARYLLLLRVRMFGGGVSADWANARPTADNYIVDSEARPWTTADNAAASIAGEFRRGFIMGTLIWPSFNHHNRNFGASDSAFAFNKYTGPPRDGCNNAVLKAVFPNSPGTCNAVSFSEDGAGSRSTLIVTKYGGNQPDGNDNTERVIVAYNKFDSDAVSGGAFSGTSDGRNCGDRIVDAIREGDFILSGFSNYNIVTRMTVRNNVASTSGLAHQVQETCQNINGVGMTDQVDIRNNTCFTTSTNPAACVNSQGSGSILGPPGEITNVRVRDNLVYAPNATNPPVIGQSTGVTVNSGNAPIGSGSANPFFGTDFTQYGSFKRRSPPATTIGALVLDPAQVPPPPACFNDASCSDNNLCNGIESCVSSQCQSGTPLQCNPTDTCKVGSCNASTGCSVTNIANGTSCNDGNANTSSDQCQSGVCVGTPVTSPPTLDKVRAFNSRTGASICDPCANAATLNLGIDGNTQIDGITLEVVQSGTPIATGSVCLSVDSVVTSCDNEPPHLFDVSGSGTLLPLAQINTPGTYTVVATPYSLPRTNPTTGGGTSGTALTRIYTTENPDPPAPVVAPAITGFSIVNLPGGLASRSISGTATIRKAVAPTFTFRTTFNADTDNACLVINGFDFGCSAVSGSVLDINFPAEQTAQLYSYQITPRNTTSGTVTGTTGTVSINLLNTAATCTTDGCCNDANICNGVETVDLDGTCANPADLVCSSPPDQQCQQATCNAISGCGVGNVADGTTCNDDNTSTVNDVCTSGTCAGTASLTCSRDTCTGLYGQYPTPDQLLSQSLCIATFGLFTAAQANNPSFGLCQSLYGAVSSADKSYCLATFPESKSEGRARFPITKNESRQLFPITLNEARAQHPVTNEEAATKLNQSLDCVPVRLPDTSLECGEIELP